MFDFLRRYLPPRVAALLTTLWYALLIFLTLVFWSGADVFRYGNL